MILDTLSNAGTYLFPYAGISQVLEAAKSYTPENFSRGIVELDGRRVYMNLASYETHAPEGALAEAHQRYIDVMVMVEGEETIYVKDVNRLEKITKPYSETGDVLLADRDADTTAVRLAPGQFLVLFPQDAHSPGCHADGPMTVKKIVGKVRI